MTGNSWETSIKNVEGSLFFKTDELIKEQKIFCYSESSDLKKSKCHIQIYENLIEFQSDEELSPKEGLIVFIKWKSELVGNDSKSTGILNTIVSNKKLIFLLLSIFIISIFYIWFRSIKNKDME